MLLTLVMAVSWTELVETYMPLANGAPIYNKPDAEKAWAKLVALYKTALA